MKMIFKFVFPLAIILTATFTTQAQDDLYGDKRPPKEKETKTKIEKNRPSYAKPAYTSKTPVSSNVVWNDPVSSEEAILFFCRKFEGNKLPIALFKNNELIGELQRDNQFNYKVLTEGTYTIKAFADGITRQQSLTIQKGQKYFFEVSMMNPGLIKEVTEDYALAYFRPSSIKRLIENTEKPVEKKARPTATGFLISPEGYIVTNYQAIDSAKAIYVKGFRDNMEVKLPAEFLLGDRANNLALLKVKDSISVSELPYGFKNALLEIGDTVLIYGYSNNAIKIVPSVIISRSGFHGDINSYQISSEINQEYNGAPVFDTKGNVVGIVNSKSGTINFSGAVKSRVLFNLLEESGRTKLPSEKILTDFPEKMNSNSSDILLIETE